MSFNLKELEQLYAKARQVPEEYQFVNKYTYALYNGILDGRYMDINDVFNNESVLTGYISKHNAILLFPSYIDNILVSLFIRPVTGNISPLKLGLPVLMYGLGNLDENFKYGSKLYIVEGIGDYLALKLIEPSINVVAILSNTVSLNSIELISNLTNNVVLVTDGDEAGDIGYRVASSKFKKLGVNVSRIKPYGKHKDVGEVLDCIVEYKKTGDLSIKEKINEQVSYYKTAIYIGS